MNVTPILQQFLLDVTPSMHSVRRQAVQACVSSLLQGSAATVTAIGRGIDSNAKENHTIKRADRLCSNIALQQEKGDVTQTKGSASLIFKDS